MIAAATIACAIVMQLNGGRAAALPRATLISAATIRLPGEVDSNSPSVWELEAGRPRLYVLTSWGGRPSVSTGSTLQTLGAARPSAIAPWPEGGNWIEAVVPDIDGTWYGYYHNERPADLVCPGTERPMLRIGAAISRNRGATWQDLGVILAAPIGSQACSSTSKYLVGGVGDFSVMLDRTSTYAYIFYSAYPRQASFQGVSVARFLWADRDAPVRRVDVWREGVWLPPREARRPSEDSPDPMLLYRSGTPFFPVGEPWHDANTIVDAFWGPSVHWNTHLRQYVMLLNRAKSSNFDPEGIYVSFAPDLENPAHWSAPARIVQGGDWYPQVVGTATGVGTDKIAGETARFFMGRQSSFLIRFSN